VAHKPLVGDAVRLQAVARLLEDDAIPERLNKNGLVVDIDLR
jgi:hypothetical protein